MPESPPVARRGRGRSAGIDRDAIVTASRDIAPEALSLQAVADELGVDRSAVSYHVRDRDGLFALVARDTFARHFASFRLSAEADWQTGCFAYAKALRDALVATGDLVTYFRFDVGEGMHMLDEAEQLLEKLLDAGFPRELVASATLMLANIAMSLARDILFLDEKGEHPQPALVRSAIESAEPEKFRAFREIMAHERADYGDAQLRTSITIFVRGMESILADTTTS